MKKIAIILYLFWQVTINGLQANPFEFRVIGNGGDAFLQINAKLNPFQKINIDTLNVIDKTPDNTIGRSLYDVEITLQLVSDSSNCSNEHIYNREIVTLDIPLDTSNIFTGFNERKMSNIYLTYNGLIDTIVINQTFRYGTFYSCTTIDIYCLKDSFPDNQSFLDKLNSKYKDNNFVYLLEFIEYTNDTVLVKDLNASPYSSWDPPRFNYYDYVIYERINMKIITKPKGIFNNNSISFLSGNESLRQ